MATNTPTPRVAVLRDAGLGQGGAGATRLLRGPLRVFGRILNAAATVAVVVGVIAFAGFAIGPHVLHYETITMLTGSMSPTIKPGDVVIDTEEPSNDLRAGQIISYHIPVYDHHVESHRVISVKHLPGGVVSFQTKGDANQAADPWVAETSAPSVWQVRTVLPGVGLGIRALRQPLVSDALRWGAPALLVVVLLMTIWTRRDEDPQPGEEDR